MLKKKFLAFVAHLFLIASFVSLIPIWVGDLFSHFRMFWTVFSIFLLIIYIILFNKKQVQSKVVLVIFFSFFINFVGSYSFWTNAQTYSYLFFGSPDKIEYSEKIEQEIQSDTTTKKLLLMNILSSNTNYEDVKRTIKNTNADFVVILELNKKWQTELKELHSIYVYQSENPRENNFGIGFYSKDSISAFEVYSNPVDANQLLDMKLKDNLVGLEVKYLNKNLKIIITHPIPPISRRAYSLRNNETSFFSKRAKKFSTQPTLLIGDLNCSPFSADYKRFLKQSDLKDSQKNFGFQPTWHNNLPFLMQTQLDHIWHSKAIEILHRQTLPIEGSDHKAVFVVFR